MHRRTLTVLVAAVLLAASGCASGSSQGGAGGGTASASPSAGIASSEPDPAGKVVEVTVSVRDGKVTPSTHRVKVPLGSRVRLQVTSDVDDELHVHGFEVEEPLEAGRTTTVELTADQSGLFEVETHETELQLVQLEIR